MRKRKSFPLFILLVALTSFPVTNVLAGTDYLFGPSEYLRTTTKTTDVYVETFPATPGEARLVVENGDGTGRWGVEGTRILVNGTEIIGSDNFSAGCMHPSCKMVQPVLLTTENTISIELIQGKKNSRLTVYIIRVPSVNIDADPTSIDQGEAAVLTWASSNANSINITGAYTGTDPAGSIEVRPSETTRYTITATGPLGTATDSCVVRVAHSSDIVFGPNQYNRTKGKADLYTETFSASPGQGRLIIKNGEETGGSRIMNATILLNGLEIFSPSDFGASIYQLEKNVTLASVNTLAITLKKGEKNSYLTIYVIQDQLPTVSISANPVIVVKGDESILSWTSTNANSCTIEPGIGAVGPEGSIEVSPMETTTYTITASGSGGSASSTATVSVYPLPMVTISADPPYIQPGGTSTLVWTSLDADSCMIEPDIGGVASSGTVEVSPTGTTTYTITAEGMGGSTAESVTVSVIDPPTVSISANPQTVYTGEASTLSWTSVNAASCIIYEYGSDPQNPLNTYPVDTAGTLDVLPTQTSTYTIIAANPMGEVSDSVIVSYIYSPIQLNITFPGTGEYISRPYTLVKGTVIDSSPADEIGVTINGAMAMVFQNEFAANHVPLENGENIITVIATDSEGNVRSRSITVFADIDVDHIWVTSGNESRGLSYTTELEIDGSFNFLSPNLSHTGPGNVEYLETHDNTFLVRIDWGGIYYFHFEAVDRQNNEYDDTLAVLVHGNSVIDALLQRRWTSLLDDLNVGDMNSALDLVHSEKRHLFEMIFGNMIQKMPDFMATYLGITLISVYGNEAEYKISTIENGVRYKYPLYFHKDTNGLWKVLSF